MARIQGLVGGISGKMGNAVFRQRYGETVLTQYQPHVANPNTDGQVEQRAKFKLISQLAAVLSDFTAIPRRGAVSGRNTFSKINLPAASATSVGGKLVSVSLNALDVKLTDSSIDAPSINVIPQPSEITVNGVGTLPVTHRPARQGRNPRTGSNPRVCLTLVSLGNNSNGQQPVVVGYTEAACEPDNGRFAHTFEYSISPDEKVCVYAYELMDVGQGVSERYDNLLAKVDRDEPLYFLELAGSVNFDGILISDTAAAITSLS